MNNVHHMIWVPGWTYADSEKPVVAYFRKKVVLSGKVKYIDLKISADTRYKLYINGTFVQCGPQKGNLESWHFDRMAESTFLREGENVIAIEVLRFPENPDKRNRSLLIGPKPFLYIEGLIKTTDVEIKLDGGNDWRCERASHVKLKREPFIPAPIHGIEEVHGKPFFTGWKTAEYDDSTWEMAVEAIAESEFLSCAGQTNMQERTIPYQKTKEQRFTDVVCVREPVWEEQRIRTAVKKLLDKDVTLRIPANTKWVVEITAGELMCGFLQLAMRGGKGAKIKMLCSESYSREGEAGPVKEDRTDYIHGQLRGAENCYIVAGNGTEECLETYEPFWFSTFLFLKIQIETAKEDLELVKFCYRKTGYPLEVKTSGKASDPDFDRIWEISERTLRRCMHETYMDCPFYEQLSYAMDSRAEILFTYAIAADDRLARRCMEDFKFSRRADGMINSCSPTTDINIIPGFSVYYILMVHDHMMYFGDRELVKDHMPTIDGILRFFERNIKGNGLVGKIGGPLFKHYYWSFIDWAPEWNATMGVPGCTLIGPLTVESLLYSIGLQKAAELSEYIGRTDMAAEYRQRARQINQAVRVHCMGENRLVQDGPDVDSYSCHGQVFAVLADAVTEEEGKRMLEEVTGNPAYAQCSVSMSFYLFRALEKVGLYEKTKDMWNLWRDMLKNNMTTCVENNIDGRSDCHAWGSLILYELPSVILGVRPAAPGYKKISVTPVPGYLDWAKGDVITPRGIVHVSWKKDKQGNLIVEHCIDEKGEKAYED